MELAENQLMTLIVKQLLLQKGLVDEAIIVLNISFLVAPREVKALFRLPSSHLPPGFNYVILILGHSTFMLQRHCHRRVNLCPLPSAWKCGWILPSLVLKNTSQSVPS